MNELNKQEQREAKEWRIRKCGYDDFEKLFILFKLEVDYGKDNIE